MRAEPTEPLVGDAATLLLPATDDELMSALGGLKVSRMMVGHRGGDTADVGALVRELQNIAHLFAERAEILEIEVNPLFVYASGVCAVDALVTT